MAFTLGCKEYEGTFTTFETIDWYSDGQHVSLNNNSYSAKLKVDENRFALTIGGIDPVYLPYEFGTLDYGEEFVIQDVLSSYDLHGLLKQSKKHSKEKTKYSACTYKETVRVCDEYEMRQACYLKTNFKLGWRKIVYKDIVSTDILTLDLVQQSTSKTVGTFKLIEKDGERSSTVLHRSDCGKDKN